MRLFADNSVIYREIHSNDDHRILQQDSHTLARWSAKWLMGFRIGKCVTLTTRKRCQSPHQYEISNEPVSRVEQYKYLGVIVSNDLSWNKQCQQITQKAGRTLGLIRRTLSPCSKDVKSMAYKSLVRPKLEYGSAAWNPYTKTATDRLEQIKKTAARFVQRDFRRTTSSSALVTNLGWDTLHKR